VGTSTAMDVVLELFDTFLFDRLYASLLPASSIQFARTLVKHAATSTFSSMREMPSANNFANKFIQFEPSQYACMSALPRDNIWRQALSLYLITWYVTVLPGCFRPITDPSQGSSASSSISFSHRCPTSSSLTMSLSPTRNTSRIKYALRFGRP